MFPMLFVPPAIFGLPAFTSASAIPAIDLTLMVTAVAIGFVAVAVGSWSRQRAALSRRHSRPQSRPQSRPIGSLPIGAAAARHTA